MSDLNPCPFCGCTRWTVTDRGENYSMCKKCGCEVDDEVINTRPIEDALRAELETVKRKNKMLSIQARSSLANNLCPDHRDKQSRKSCLACEIERLKDIEQSEHVQSDWISPIEATRIQAKMERIKSELETARAEIDTVKSICKNDRFGYDGTETLSWNVELLMDALKADVEAAKTEIERLTKAAPGPFTVIIKIPDTIDGGECNDDCPTKIDDHTCGIGLGSYPTMCMIPGPGCPQFKGGKE